MENQKNILFRMANTREDFEDGRNLFQQYSKSLDIDLSFQDFPNELKMMHQQYIKPKGALILAYSNDNPVGCAGIREFDNGIAELKRMFVLQEFRKYKIGKKLLELAIDISKELNYKIMRLDTLPTMTEAQHLYRSFGFYEIQSYRFNPIKGTIFMEKNLLDKLNVKNI